MKDFVWCNHADAQKDFLVCNQYIDYVFRNLSHPIGEFPTYAISQIKSLGDLTNLIKELDSTKLFPYLLNRPVEEEEKK
jgi:hypothetical protein